ncbi:MAG: hypothetical protein A3H98_04690 [Bacteroidetes bacterium RIFCSPLOWO2_02_FULL_36_8]|nr:MAG: hypothetical protein A3H98_04690 [Bacteroidetes bacterium RIFCSPLOWO2_02_FULL_36_8]OFY72116.1 MAG: hypothetical protein A3G23_07070 [Bacteroidetes bacterium RIFCSPLOWO2_12_FULL_37_12]
MTFKSFFAGFALCFYLILPSAYSQNSQTTFGRNRVQQKGFIWLYQRSQNFDVYFYKGGNAVAKHAIIHSEREFPRLTSLMGYAPENKIEILVYNSTYDMEQSNIGLSQEITLNGGETRLVKNKLSIPFDGSYISFEHTLTTRLSEVLLNEMMYGGSFQEILQNAYLLNLPEWYTEGLYAYLSVGWSSDMDDFMRAAVVSNRFKKASNFSKNEAMFTGQAIWNYIVEEYGVNSISNILNLTRLTRNVESAISTSLGISFDAFLKKWITYYEQAYQHSINNYVMPDDSLLIIKRNRRNKLYNHLKLNPDGNSVAYTVNYNGKYKVVIMNLETRKRKTILRGGDFTEIQEINFNIPLISWNPTGKKLAVMNLTKGKVSLFIINMETKEKIQINFPLFTNINSFNYSQDGGSIVVSAVMNGKTDIFVYTFKNQRLTQITDDSFDDLDPFFLKGSKTIIFVSNRRDYTGKYVRADYDMIENVYDLYSAEKVKWDIKLKRLTQTQGHEKNPIQGADSEIIYISDENGIESLYRLNSETGENNKMTQFDTGIKSFDFNADSGSLITIMNHRGKNKLFYWKNFTHTTEFLDIQTLRQSLLKSRAIEEENERLSTNVQDTSVTFRSDTIRNSPISSSNDPKNKPQEDTAKSSINIYDYRFESDSTASTNKNNDQNMTWNIPADNFKAPNLLSSKKPDTLINESNLKISEPYPYGLRFNLAKFVTGINFSPYHGVHGIVGVDLMDFFENHRLEAYLLLLPNARNTSYSIKYSYLVKKPDFVLQYEKVSIGYEFQNYLRNVDHYDISGYVSYPFSRSKSIKAGPHFSLFSINDPLQLDARDTARFYTGGLFTEFVCDNILNRGINLPEGVRYKTGLKTYFRDIKLYFFYFDYRHYLPVHRLVTLASRGTFGFSGGRDATNYLIGGVDSWVIPQFDNNPYVLPYPLAGYVTNFRGFNYNFRNGDKYMMGNFELRVPIARYLYNGPISSSFLYNLQITGFTDVGTAWSGSLNPFSEEQIYQRDTLGAVTGNPVTVVMITRKAPVAMGYGFGIRSLFFGYYLKLDVAWGIDSQLKREPKFHLSMGMDF